MTIELTLYLASQSPRRRELLTQIGISFIPQAVDIDESIKPDEIAEKYVQRLANEKAVAGLSLLKHQNIAVLGSDTSVVIDGEILGKPKNDSDAKRMLTLLSGKSHKVMTAVTLAIKSEEKDKPELTSIVSVSKVTFKKLSNNEIEQYIQSGEPTDKAGSYAIQGLAAAFITHLSGSYSGVMGLPLYETAELLRKAGIRAESVVVS